MSFWANAAVTVHQKQAYAVILDRTVTFDTQHVHYTQTNSIIEKIEIEGNHLLFCKAELKDNFTVNAKDCKLIETGAGYRELHPFPERGRFFDLVGVMDPRLVSAGDSGLFLQVSSSPFPREKASAGHKMRNDYQHARSHIVDATWYVRCRWDAGQNTWH